MNNRRYTVVFSLMTGVSFQTLPKERMISYLERIGVTDRNIYAFSDMAEDPDEEIAGPGAFVMLTGKDHEQMLVFRSDQV